MSVRCRLLWFLSIFEDAEMSRLAIRRCIQDRETLRSSHSRVVAEVEFAIGKTFFRVPGHDVYEAFA